MAFDPDAYLAQKSVGASASFDPDAYLKSKGLDVSTSSEPSTMAKISDTVSKAFPHTMFGAATNPAVQDLALRGLDYAGGLGRTGLAAATGNASMDDLYSALKGRATRSAEFLKRAGVPEGPTVPLTNFSARDAGGFVGDIATDPLTYVQPLNRVMGAGQAVEAMGNAAYKSGLKNIDMEVAKYGKEPVSDLLMKNRVTGSARSIADQMQEMADQRLANRNAILQRATDRGATVDLEKAMSKPQDYVDKLKSLNNPEMGDAVDKLQSRIEDYTNRAYDTDQMATPIQTSAWKSSAANRVSDADYQRMAYSPEATQFNKKLASGLRQATEDSVENTLGKTEASNLRQHNDELGRLLTSQDRAERDALIEGRKNNHTSVDGMLIGHAVEKMDPSGLVPYLAKKLSDVSKATGPRTTTGLFMQDLGQTGIPDALAKRVLINQNDPNTPWINLSRRQP